MLGNPLGPEGSNGNVILVCLQDTAWSWHTGKQHLADFVNFQGAAIIESVMFELVRFVMEI